MIDPKLRLTYRFVEPNVPAMEHAMQALGVFDGELLEVTRTDGDTIVDLTARVRTETWAKNPEVWGEDPDGRVERVYFGRVHDYLAGDPCFRILVIPSMDVRNDRDRLVTFLPFAETGYLVGSARGAMRTAARLPDSGPQRSAGTAPGNASRLEEGRKRARNAGIQLLWLSGVVLLFTAYVLGPAASVKGVVRFGFTAVLVWRMSLGANWARWLLGVGSLVGGALGLYYFVTDSFELFFLTFGASYLWLGWVLVFHPAVRAFFDFKASES